MKQRLVLSDVAACEGKADGWGERACAAALTVGLIFWILFYQEKSIGKISCGSRDKNLCVYV